MALIYEWGFNVDPGRADEFVGWLDEHEDRLARSTPTRYEYLGTYLPVWGVTGPRTYRALWRYETGEPLDLREAMDRSDSEFAELAKQFLSFVDESRASEETFVLYRSAHEVHQRES